MGILNCINIWPDHTMKCETTLALFFYEKKDSYTNDKIYVHVLLLEYLAINDITE